MPPTCPHCSAELETPLACGGCGRLLESPETAGDPFALLGIERSHELEPGGLRKRLLRLSRLVHPDFFGQGDDETRQQAEDASAALNGAYQVLSEETRRADWLISDLGGPSETDERQMPQAFLMEVMEWNEALEEARASAPGSPPRQALAALQDSLRAERTTALDAIRAALVPLTQDQAQRPVEANGSGGGALLEARRQLNAIRYIDRALREIEALRLEEAASH